jgi:hypothetical protein
MMQFAAGIAPIDSGNCMNCFRRQLYTFVSCAFACVLLASPFISCPPSFAQQIKAQGTRKIVVRVTPVYPVLARRLKLAGTVKLVAVVAPEGNVVRTEVIGGNPVLVQSATDAITKAKWQPGPQQTREVLEISFEPELE